jgi:hypothetical protein
MSVKISINLSRKLSKDFNSTSVTVGIESEVQSPLSRPEELLEEISGMFRLAERAVDQEFADLNHAGLDQPVPASAAVKPLTSQPAQASAPAAAKAPEPAAEPAAENGQPLISERQVKFLGTLAKRSGLAGEGLETHIASVLGRAVPVPRLTRKEAARVIDSLNQTAARN